jgi:hypothetical protein
LGLDFFDVSLASNFNANNDSKCQNDEIWTMGKLKDELYFCLASIEINGEYKYEKQGRDLIYKIPRYRPTPYFIINDSDLSTRLRKELASLDDVDLDIVIRDVLSWIYESIDKKSFLLSIKRYGLLHWRIEI